MTTQNKPAAPAAAKKSPVPAAAVTEQQAESTETTVETEDAAEGDAESATETTSEEVSEAGVSQELSAPAEQFVAGELRAMPSFRRSNAIVSIVAAQVTGVIYANGVYHKQAFATMQDPAWQEQAIALATAMADKALAAAGPDEPPAEETDATHGQEQAA